MKIKLIILLLTSIGFSTDVLSTNFKNLNVQFLGVSNGYVYYTMEFDRTIERIICRNVVGIIDESEKPIYFSCDENSIIVEVVSSQIEQKGYIKNNDLLSRGFGSMVLSGIFGLIAINSKTPNDVENFSRASYGLLTIGGIFCYFGLQNQFIELKESHQFYRIIETQEKTP